ncbi:MAG: sugar ABC transporter permease [Thermoflexales bacterium]|nr:sugar ABC transporter permease [Thermoflexales bacterium]
MARVKTFLRKHGWSYLFILPTMLTFSVFVLLPVISSLVISFQKYSLRNGGTWVDPIYKNYIDAFTTQSGVFLVAIQNTLVYSFFTVISNVLVGLILASLIQPLSQFFKTFFRAAYYLPAVTSAIVIGMTWRYIYNAQWGLANFVLRKVCTITQELVCIPEVRWLSNPDIALGSITLSTILTVPATAVVLFSAAMGGIPKEYYEAAELDGAGSLRKWWNITLPLIRSVTLYLAVLYTIASFEVFEKIYIMVPAGVANATQTIVTQIYQNGFQQFNYGVAAAQAFVLFLMIAGVAVFQFRALRSDVEY